MQKPRLRSSATSLFVCTRSAEFTNEASLEEACDPMRQFEEPFVMVSASDGRLLGVVHALDVMDASTDRRA
ncbi:hypothetical protein D779_0538 [Imhoffiella purpurea]|uniref:CBS domain-containing protein n=1 Tax=Imhoffiella purpurea TaxID=1249627 RepID=W9V9E6_9GAMM|nr:hypothetical protein D779_0538 [Imhoffiella purpurea]